MNIADRCRKAVLDRINRALTGEIAVQVEIHPVRDEPPFELPVILFPSGPLPDGDRPARNEVRMMSAPADDKGLVLLGDQVTLPDTYQGRSGPGPVTGIVVGIESIAPGGAVITQSIRVELPRVEVER